MLLQNAKTFLAAIPNELNPNVEFRKKLHALLAEDKDAQATFLAMCVEEPAIAYNACFWGYNPRLKVNQRHIPFILRPHQLEMVRGLYDAIRDGHDILIDKSRDEGATEICSKFFTLYFLLFPDSNFLVGSRKEEYVDNGTTIDGSRVTGSYRTIFYKILYTLATMPQWMRPKMDKKHMHLENLTNGSVIDGEATNPNFGAGDRRTAVLLDEFGRVEPDLAQNIRDSIADVTDCVIYNSTHFYGRGHPFAKLRFSGKIPVLVLPWWKNPEKNAGLYKSPELNMIEVPDLAYYKTSFPEAFGPIEEQPTYRITDLEVDFLARGLSPSIKFIADGAAKWRSPWYDSQCDRRDPRDIASNLDMNPAGSGDMFFDGMTLQRIRADFLRKPTLIGDIEILTTGGRVCLKRMNPNGRGMVRWYTELVNGRPNQQHNYAVGCDISLGVGASNSVACVVDVNSCEISGIFITSRNSPEEFCDLVMGLCYWVGGKSGNPFLIWEANGGQGGLFDKRRKLNGYHYCYTERSERQKNRPQTSRFGWYSSRTSKEDLLAGLRAALSEGTKAEPRGIALRVYDADIISELEDYIYYESGEIGLSSCMADIGGARAAHGDTVIAAALACLGLVEQPKARVLVSEDDRMGTLQWRQRLAKEAREQKEINKWQILGN